MLELNKIHLGDSYELLGQIETSSIDLVITDPPYSVGMTSNGAKGDFSDMNMIKPFFDAIFKNLSRVLKSGGLIYLNCDWRTYPIYYELLQRYFQIRNCIVWDYEWIKAGNFYRFSHEFIIFATQKNSEQKRTFGAGERDVWRIKPLNFTDTTNKFHQTQKPMELVKKAMLDGSRENDIVLDCFAGSGTTCVVAKENNRRFIGIEINEPMYQVAVKRLAGTQLNGQTSIFTDFTKEQETIFTALGEPTETTNQLGFRI